MLKISFLSKIIVLLLFVTTISNAQNTIPTQLKWSERMALTLMQRHPQSYMIDDAPVAHLSYVHGLVMYAFQELNKQKEDEKYAAYIKDYADVLIEADGNIKTFKMDSFNIDNIPSGRILFDLYTKTKDKRYLTAMQTLRKQLDEQPRTPSGGFWHKKIYPNQMWLDGLYMGEPFYAQYTAEFEEGKSFDDIAKQFELIQSHATEKKTGLLYHAWDESKEMPWANKETGVSPNFWSRSIGWYVMALVDVLDYFPEDHPKRKELIDDLNSVSNALVKFQDKKSGMWYQVTDMGGREGNYLESSATSMFAYAFAKGANKGYLPKKFKKTANKAFDGLTTISMKIDANGQIELTNACAVAGLGGKPYRDGSYEYYINEKKKNNDPKATGPFMLAALELNR
ncbi:glycosyl hydrolase family 88 [Flavobacterium cheongpyeongense]|jgi:unsaturated rhamnogalacturonyl hydrolase|uniref:Glycosyl hydrolase family 88 n=1 Tax=Flavobacterium cheongpyeongense TaxID=2212651 RepID=A0A2V4BT14_9FLAO|nr:glycoside hydrolase family 88 protein [Flavobacterium cheongpyeongense]PXY41777.1 glycosyl hydrolase family 88 [Flavobacterium cheongpyeongense]